MATRIDWDELFPPLPVRAPRGQTTRIDLGNIRDINQSNAVNRAAKGNMPADVVAEMLAGQSDEEQALRELSPIDALARSLEIPPRMENYQRGQNSLRTAEDILSMIPGPGNVIAARDAFQGAEDAGKAFGAGDTRGGLMNAALAALSGVGAVVGLPTSRAARDAAREGARTARIFAGPEAKTADRGALEKAKDMRARGADRDEIWKDTGWAWDERGLPYFEIDDSAAALRERGITQPQYFDDFLDHPALFEASPEIAARRFSETGRPGSGAHFKPDMLNPDGRIDVGPGSPSRRLSVALHEGQHAADLVRGASHGANANTLAPEALEETRQAMSSKFGDAFAEWEAADQAYRGMFRGAFGLQTPEMDAAIKRLAEAESVLAGVQNSPRGAVTPKSYAYHHNPGEVRARNVEARRAFSAADRQASPPWQTIDVDEADILSGRGSTDAPSQVLIPAPASKARDRALDMRDSGKTNPEVFAETKRFFGPEGQPMTEISDRGMSVDTSQFQPGDRATFGDLIDHPALFGVRPELAGVPIDFTDKFVTQQGVRGGVARRGPNQAAEITIGERPEWYREQIPKLLQYKIAEDSGLGQALRHDLVDMIPEYQRAVSGAREIIDNPRPGDDLEAAINYLAKVEPWRDRLQTAFTTREGQRTALKDATKVNAGNANARIVRGRAVAPDDVMRAWGPYPYRQNMPSFEKVIALPQENLTRDQIAQFLADWQNFGAGAGR
jgi:hypothetical protein